MGKSRVGLLEPDLVWDAACGAGEGAVLACDFHLEDLVGLLEGFDFGVGQEGDQTFLEGAEASFDFAFGLRCWSDQVSDVQGFERSLELALGVVEIVARTGAKETQRVGVNGYGNAAGLEGSPEMAEVVPGGVGLHEAACHIEARMVVHREQQGLLACRRPPLVDGAVVLPKLADVGPSKAPVNTRLARHLGNQVGQVPFNVGFHAGTGASKAARANQFIGHQLVIGGLLQRQEFFQKLDGLSRPKTPMITPADTRPIGILLAQVGRAQLVKPGSAYPQIGRGTPRIQCPLIEGPQGALYEFDRLTVDKLLFFIPTLLTAAPG